MDAVGRTDPILARLIQEYEYWRPQLVRGDVGAVTFEVRVHRPEHKRVTSYARREEIDKAVKQV